MFRCAYLLILEAEEQDLFHHGQLGLLASLGALADVSRIKGNLVAILAALVAGLWARIPGGGWRSVSNAVGVVGWVGCAASTGTAASRQS